MLKNLSILRRIVKKIPKDRSKILIFLTLVQWPCLLNFAQISPHGTAKEEYRIILVTIFRLRRRPGRGHCQPFRVLDAHPSLPLYFLCKGNGYHVNNP